MGRILPFPFHRVIVLEPVTQPVYEQRRTMHLTAGAGIEILSAQRDKGALVHLLGQCSQLRKVRSARDLTGGNQPLIHRVQHGTPAHQSQQVQARQSQDVSANGLALRPSTVNFCGKDLR
jgi:hypothetical protein